MNYSLFPDRENIFPGKFKSYTRDSWLISNVGFLTRTGLADQFKTILAWAFGLLGASFACYYSTSEGGSQVATWVFFWSSIAVFAAGACVFFESEDWQDIEQSISSSDLNEIAEYLKAYITSSKEDLKAYADCSEFDYQFKRFAILQPTSMLEHLLSDAPEKRIVGIRYMLSDKGTHTFTDDLRFAQNRRLELVDRVRVEDFMEDNIALTDEEGEASAA